MWLSSVCVHSFLARLWVIRRLTGRFSREDMIRVREREKRKRPGAIMCVGCEKMREWCYCCLSISAILVGGVGVDSGAVCLLAIFSRWHPLIYPVQAACLLKVADLSRGREALNG